MYFKGRPIQKSTAIQTSIENLPVVLTSKEDENQDVDEIKPAPSPTESSSVEDLLLDNIHERSYYFHKQPKVIPIIQKQTLVSSRSNKKHDSRPKHDLPKIRFSDQNQYITHYRQPGKTISRRSPAITASSDSNETLDDCVNVNYNYYTTPYHAEDDSEGSSNRRYLCNECSKRVQEGTGYTSTYHRWNDQLKTTISEESLSGCSLSESSTHEYKIKNITIKIGKPYYL